MCIRDRGAIAGAMAENYRLLYLEDYPIYGSVANINAFALGAKMINPRVKVYLEWTSRKRFDLYELIRNLRPDCISGKDMVIPEEATRSFGIYRQEGDYTQSLAMPLWHWGRFYELLIRTIMDGKMCIRDRYNETYFSPGKPLRTKSPTDSQYGRDENGIKSPEFFFLSVLTFPAEFLKPQDDFPRHIPRKMHHPR